MQKQVKGRIFRKKMTNLKYMRISNKYDRILTIEWLGVWSTGKPGGYLAGRERKHSGRAIISVNEKILYIYMKNMLR